MNKQELAREFSEPKIKPAYEKAGRDKAFFTAEMLQNITENCYIAGFNKALELIEEWVENKYASKVVKTKLYYTMQPEDLLAKLDLLEKGGE